MTNLDSILKSRNYFDNKGPSSQSYGFSSGHVWMWELDYKESWVPRNWCFWTVVLEKTLESPLDCKEIQPVHSEGDLPWVFIGRTDAEAETPILRPPDMKNWLIEKDPDAGKDWRLEEKGMTEDEMIGWHHWLDWHQFEQSPGVGDVVSCSPWGHKDSDTTEWLKWTELMSMWGVIACVVGWGCLLWPVCSLGKTVSLCLLQFVLQGQTCLLPQVSLDFLCLHLSPLWWKVHLFYCC